MNKSIELMDKREKLIYLRKTLKTTQRALAGDTLTKEFISMVEGGKRNMSREVAITVMKNALNLANEKGIDLGLDEEYLTRSKEDDLCEICDKLDNTMENMDNFNKIIEYAEENNYPWAKIMATKKVGNVYFINKNLNEAYKKYMECLEFIDAFKSNKFKQNVYNCIGNIKFYSVQYEEAMVYYEEALNYCFLNNNFSIRNNIEYNLALTYFNLNDYNKCFKKIEEVLKRSMAKGLHLKFKLLQGSVYMELGLFKQALNLYEGISKYSLLNNETKGIVYNNIALCYMYNTQYDDARKYFNLASDATKLIPYMSHKIIWDKARLEQILGQYEEAKKLFLQGMMLSEKVNDYKYKLRYLENLYLLEGTNTKELREILHKILNVSKQLNLQNKMIWARKKLIDIAIKENDLSILKSV